MSNKVLLRFLVAGFLVGSFPLSGFGQECDKYLNKQTNTVKTGNIIAKVLGKTVDGILGTNFSSVIGQKSDQMQMLDILQYNTCMQLQTIKNEFVRENLEEKTRNTLNEMVKLLTQSGTLPPEVLNLLVENGSIEPSLIGKITSSESIPLQPNTLSPTADEVGVPVLPAPAKPGWGKVEFPCQTFTVSGSGIIRARGMETNSDPQIAKSIASIIALEELASKIEITMNSVTEYYVKSVSGDNEELVKDFRRKTKTTVNQTLRGYTTVCEEYRQHSETEKYQCFVALEISEKNVLKPVYDGLNLDAAAKKVLPNFEKFKQTFTEVMNFYEKTGF